MKKTRFYILFLVLFTLDTFAIAQVDTTYVHSFKQNFSAKVYGGYNFTMLTRQYASFPEETYVPNVPPYIGIGASWKGIGGSFYYGLKFMTPQKKEERSEYLDLQLHYYGERFVFDFFGQRYSGFSIQNDNIQHFNSDIGVVELGGFLQYNFNYKHFSYSAAFDQTKKQLKSAGTPLVSLAFYYTKVNADSLFITENVNHKTHYLFGPSAGYAYTWVFRNNYFATGSISFGLNASLDNLNNKIGVCPTFFPRISSGYNAETWAWAFSAQFNFVFLSYAKTDKLGMGTLNAQVTFIKRFDFKSKFLDKITFQNHVSTKEK